MVNFTIAGGTTMTFLYDTTLVRLSDGNEVQADALQNGDVFMANGDWLTVGSTPVVT